jgi:hypothetical protein
MCAPTSRSPLLASLSVTTDKIFEETYQHADEVARVMERTVASSVPIIGRKTL